MDKTHISNATYEVLMRAGINAGLVGAGRALAMKDAGRSQIGAHPQVLADAPGGEGHPPIGQRGGVHWPMGIGKDRGTITPAKFTVLQLVSSRCLTTAQPTRLPRAAVVKHLMLVVDNT